MRYSPKKFDESIIDKSELYPLFEAARWSASAYNEQPWRFFVALRTDRETFAAFLGALNEGNRTWAATASALMLTAAQRERRRDGELNAYAWHDVGQAVAHLTIRALHAGLYVHQMQGFNPKAVRALLKLPSGFDPVTAVAIGRPAAGEAAQAKARTRHDLDSVLFFPSASGV